MAVKARPRCCGGGKVLANVLAMLRQEDTTGSLEMETGNHLAQAAKGGIIPTPTMTIGSRLAAAVARAVNERPQGLTPDRHCSVFSQRKQGRLGQKHQAAREQTAAFCG